MKMSNNNLNRRRFLQQATLTISATGWWLQNSAYADTQISAHHGQNGNSANAGEHQRFMAMAIEESRRGMAAGEPPFGAVIVRDGKVIGRAYSTVAQDHDPTAHAETMAIRDATAKLGVTELSGATLYTSCEPCPMCCGSILNAYIDTLIISGSRTKLLKLLGLDPAADSYSPETLARMTNAPLNVVRGILQEESERVLESFPAWAYLAPPSLSGQK